jgi:hypothetical protein
MLVIPWGGVGLDRITPAGAQRAKEVNAGNRFREGKVSPPGWTGECAGVLGHPGSSTIHPDSFKPGAGFPGLKGEHRFRRPLPKGATRWETLVPPPGVRPIPGIGHLRPLSGALSD